MLNIWQNEKRQGTILPQGTKCVRTTVGKKVGKVTGVMGIWREFNSQILYFLLLIANCGVGLIFLCTVKPIAQSIDLNIRKNKNTIT